MAETGWLITAQRNTTKPMSIIKIIVDGAAFIVLCAATYFGIQTFNRVGEVNNKSEQVHEQLTQLEQDMEKIREKQEDLKIVCQDLEQEKEKLDDEITSLKEELGIEDEEESEDNQEGSADQTETRFGMKSSLCRGRRKIFERSLRRREKRTRSNSRRWSGTTKNAPGRNT